ncbi:hypothetical protein M422DRAFT_257990 [Sphaerobolus stellatus SS14]|uniref:Uncharacterized protein n=1 Tax=Sphaerobolus stellatus (strain SS14) TaxID=990650 RepID=A0A0C9VN21_SPHS4|nr:hypothetical protein M422DRAFT_257990 [Sphaerobolus stellatus SS14]
MRKETFRGDLIEVLGMDNARARRIIRIPTLPISTSRRRGRPSKVLEPHSRQNAITPTAAVPKRSAYHSTTCTTTKRAPPQFEKASNCDQGSHTVTYGTGNKVHLISQSDDYCLSNREKRVEGTNADVTWRDVVIHRANRAGPTRQSRIVDPQTLEEERINNCLPQKQNNRRARPEQPVPVQVRNNLNGAIERQLQDLEKLKSSKSELEVALTRKQMEVKVYEEELRRIVMKEKEMDCALEAVFFG